MVQVLCLTRGEFWEGPLRESGITVSWVGQSSNRILRLFRILSLLYSIKPTILHSAHFYTNLYVALAGRLLALPSIGAMRNDCFNEVANSGKFLGTMQLKLPRIIAGNSLNGIENARSLGIASDRIYFLPNVIDTGRFRIVAKQKKRPILVLSAGRLTEQKRPDRFIRLMARLQREMPGKVRGVMVGDGPLRPALERQARKAGLLPEQLSFLGQVTHMEEVYANASVLVLTSDWEGTPNVVMEAMACGLAVVATHVGGVSDLIRDGETGLLIHPNDEDQLFVALNTLVENPSLMDRLGRKGMEFIRNQHSLESLPNHLMELYMKFVPFE